MQSKEEPSLELVVRVLNINSGCNQKLLTDCKELGDYAEFTRLVRLYQEKYSLDMAVDFAIDECIRKGCLKDFLERNRAEVKKMSLYEYGSEKHIRMEREEAREEGREEGQEEGFELTKRLLEEKRYEDLERAIKDAAYRKQLFLEFGIC